MANADEFWEGFGEDDGGPNITCGSDGSLAQDVLNKYDIPCSDTVGGSLPGLDIKHMDAMQVIKLSLLEESSNSGNIYEPVMGGDGFVEFKQVGSGRGPSDIYYELQTGTYKEDCSGVIVQGKNPMPVRVQTEWRSIWENVDKEIYDTGYMHNNCVAGDFNQYATIVYDDPHLNTAYNDGIDNIYDIINPWETLIGYANYIKWTGQVEDKDSVVNFSDSAKILVEIPEKNLGIPQRRPIANTDLSENESCFEGQGVIPPNGVGVGVEVLLPEHFRFESVRDTIVDKFSGISGVYILGRGIEDIRTSPAYNLVANSPSMGNATVWARITKNYDEIFGLEQGRHYVVNYDNIKEGGNPEIIFADNSRVTDPIETMEGGLLHFFIDPSCTYAIDEDGEAIEEDIQVVLLTGPTQGIIVHQIFVAVELDTPSVVIYHPDGWNRKAREIADSFIYDVMPLISYDEPAPMAFNGSLIDQRGSIKDHDPTTAQNFSNTEHELVLDKIDAGGGMTLTLSFLNKAQCIVLSDTIYDYMNSGSGVEATYVCGPNCDAELGGSGPNGGVVNSIVYSYQDSNSYTVSVNCGPVLVGGQLAQVDGGPALKIVESVTTKGTIIEDSGNNIYYKVSIDGIGDRIAVNMIPAVLRVGDKVSVAVHNNPVEA